jgi:hypothetical protein
MIECWVDGEHHDTLALAAAELKVSQSFLSRAHKETSQIKVRDKSGQVRTVDFYPPSPAASPTPPPMARKPGSMLILGPVTHRLGVYR